MGGHELARNSRGTVELDRRRIEELTAMPDEQLFSEIIELERAVELAVDEAKDHSDALVRAVGVALERWMPEAIAEQLKRAEVDG